MAAGMGLTGKIYWGDLLSGQHSLHIKECSDFTPPPPVIANIFSLPCQLDGMGRKQPLSAVAYWKVTRIFRWMYITF